MSYLILALKVVWPFLQELIIERRKKLNNRFNILMYTFLVLLTVLNLYLTHHLYTTKISNPTSEAISNIKRTDGDTQETLKYVCNGEETCEIIVNNIDNINYIFVRNQYYILVPLISKKDEPENELMCYNKNLDIINIK